MSKKNLTIIFILIIALMIGVVIGIIVYIKGSGDKVKEVPTFTVGIDDMYCNIKDSKKMVKINIVIETIDEKLKKTIESKKFLTRDMANEIIASKTEEELLGEKGQTKLKDEILKRLIDIFESEKITSIYFNDFIIQ